MRILRRHWIGATTIASAAATPFAAWAMGESSLRAAVVLGAIAGISAARNWLAEPPRARAPERP